mgnify:CR=1 FL=1|tara:strand:+ start:654 stop:938 length:285 start_codon:yes stop_codon:yes gene_type:complete
MSEQQQWTYTSEDGTYAVDRFTDEGKYAFVLILQIDKEIQEVRKTLAKLEMAAKGFNGTVLQQLTDDMLVDEEDNVGLGESIPDNSNEAATTEE